MIYICFCLILPFTRVLSYPSIHQNSDRFELPNEFWSQHFGSDFKDAVHFNLQQSHVLDNGNRLYKHFPENQNNGNFKRSAYVLHSPQYVEPQNRSMENFMKVHILSPGEIEALESGMRGKDMSKSPVVVTLPGYGSIPPPPASYNTPTFSILPNTPPVVYHNNPNNVHPQFLQNNHHIWPESQHYSPKFMYQQLPRTLYEKTMKPSYEKLFMKPFKQSYHDNIFMPHEQISILSKDKMSELLMKPSLEKSIQHSTQNPSYEQILSPEQISLPSKNKMEDVLLKTSLEKPIQHVPQLPSYDQHKNEQNLSEISSYDVTTVQSSNDKKQPSADDEMQPSTDKMQPLNDKIEETSTDKPQPSTDEMQPSSESSYEAIQAFYRKIRPTHETIHATFEKTPASHPSYEEISPSFEPKKSNNDKSNPQGHYANMQRLSFNKNRMMPYDRTLPTDPESSQSSNTEEFEHTFEPKQMGDVKYEYRSEEKTAA